MPCHAAEKDSSAAAIAADFAAEYVLGLHGCVDDSEWDLGRSVIQSLVGGLVAIIFFSH